MAKAPTKAEPKAEKAEAKLVKMTRDGKSADVHPNEVENYAAGGWEKA